MVSLKPYKSRFSPAYASRVQAFQFFEPSEGTRPVEKTLHSFDQYHPRVRYNAEDDAFYATAPTRNGTPMKLFDRCYVVYEDASPYVTVFTEGHFNSVFVECPAEASGSSETNEEKKMCAAAYNNETSVSVDSSASTGHSHAVRGTSVSGALYNTLQELWTVRRKEIEAELVTDKGWLPPLIALKHAAEFYNTMAKITEMHNQHQGE